MELFITSDLHYGTTDAGDRAVEAIAAHVVAHGADALLIAGDLAIDEAALERCLALFAGCAGPKLAVPGNHDVWLPYEDDDGCSFELHERTLPRLFERHGFHPLHLRPLVLGGVGFVGSMGWYDYSFRDEELGFPLAAYEAKTFPGDGGPLWNDARYARMGHTDVELTELLLRRLEAQLAEVRADEVVAMLHHVPTKELLFFPRALVPKRWRFANAFLGSERLSELIAGDPRVRHTFCGHIHRGRSASKGRHVFTSVGDSDAGKRLLVRTTPTRPLGARVFAG